MSCAISGRTIDPQRARTGLASSRRVDASQAQGAFWVYSSLEVRRFCDWRCFGQGALRLQWFSSPVPTGGQGSTGGVDNLVDLFHLIGG